MKHLTTEWLKAARDDDIEARYPGELGLLPNGKPTMENAKEFKNLAIAVLDYTKQLFL